jgi:hypothetical protein
MEAQKLFEPYNVEERVAQLKANIATHPRNVTAAAFDEAWFNGLTDDQK